MSRQGLRERTKPIAPGTKDRPATAEPVEYLPWLGPIGITVLSCLILFVAWQFLRSQQGWFDPLVRDLARWIRHPEIAGGWRPPAAPGAALAIVCLAGFIGWRASTLMLRRSRLADDRILGIGLSIVVGICALGYAGMLGLVFGLLSGPVLWVFLLVAAAGLVAVKRRVDRDRPATEDDVVDVAAAELPGPRANRSLKVATAGAATAITIFMSLHAALAPVQEWDAVVYHAASAKNWFEQRPDPPLVYGPSVGIEISGNYPPLFPAAGAATYTLIGRFDDLYLRILPPLLFAAILLMTFGYGRRRLGERAACFAVLLMLGTPLLLMYGVWPTGYVLLGACLLATAILVDLAATHGELWRWALAGIVGGLTVLSHVYGFMAVPLVLAAILVFRRGRRPATLVAFLGVVAVVAAPWLIRNLVLLHDPFYPLGSPPFPGRGLVQPIWDASKEEVKSAALGFWEISSGSSLRFEQVATVLFDRNLLPLGLYFGLALGIGLVRRSRAMAFLSFSLVVVLVALLAPGWYWLRGIVPGLPLAALLTGRGLDLLLESGRRIRRERGRVLGVAIRTVTVAAVTLPLAGGAVIGAGLAAAGPNQRTWTTSLTREDDFAGGIRTLGDQRQILWNVFGGDSLLWEWLNRVVAPGERIATLEVRTYYLDRPQDLFYLDGLEAAPLLRMRDPAEVERFLRSKGVRYVLLPSWAAQGQTSHPIVRILPFFDVLGTTRFPLVATSALGGLETPSLVFSVGPSARIPEPGIFPGSGQPVPAATDPTLSIAPGEVDPRIFAPMPSWGPTALAFDFDRKSVGGFALNYFHRPSLEWELNLFRGSGGGQGWGTALVPLPPSGMYADLGLFVQRGRLHLRHLRLVPLVAPVVVSGAAGDADRAGTYVTHPGARPLGVGVPVDGRARLVFSWHGRRGSRPEVRVRRTDGTWHRVVATPAHGRSWTIASVDLSSAQPGAVMVRIVARGGDLVVRGLRLGEN